MQCRILQVYCPATALADEMVVTALLGDVIPDAAFSKVGLGDQAQFLEQFQGSVHSRYVDVRVTATELPVYLLGTDVPVGVVKSLNDQHPLESHAVSPLLKNLVAAHRQRAV